MTKCHYTEVLSATDGRMVSHNGMEGVYHIFDAVAGPGVSTIAISYLSKPVARYLKEKFPKYANPQIEQSLSVALDEWKVDGRKENALPSYLQKHVLPLLGEEYVEVEHMSEEKTNDLLEHYSSFLNDKFKDKEVIGVVVEKKHQA